MPEPIPVRIAHHMAGRTRLTAPAEVSGDALRACAERIAASGAVSAVVRGNSLILTHAAALPRAAAPHGLPPSLAALLAEAGLAVAPEPPRHPIGRTASALGRLNGAFAQASGGRMDVTNAAFVALVAAGFVQLARGRVAGPAITLFGQALTLALLHDKLQER
ncbi:hypothetical protein V5F38_09150 [Xanthobacter sp. V0B-10]|uniref:hypothetical protein n=1 Tax=Xanthobacter albus TaxID=3119929 RepID=UPI00372B9DAE